MGVEKPGSFLFLCFYDERRNGVFGDGGRGDVEGYVTELVSFLSIAEYLPPLIKTAIAETPHSRLSKTGVFFIDTRVLFRVAYAPIHCKA